VNLPGRYVYLQNLCNKVPDVQLQIGDRAPAFTLPNALGSKTKLADYRGQRVLLYAYPAAMTPGCTTQACDFRDDLAVFTSSDIQVIGISPDSVDKLATFTQRDQLTFPLCSDPQKAVLTKYGAYGEKKLYGKVVTGVIRSTFVISPTGRIEHVMYNVKATGHVAKLIRDLDLH
jgi:peroxiredoxin Q/BCP